MGAENSPRYSVQDVGDSPKLPEAAPRRSPESWGGVAERSAFGGLASSKVPLLKKSGASEDFGTIKGVRAVSSRINPSEQYYWFCISL